MSSGFSRTVTEGQVRAEGIAEDAVDAVKARPMAVGGVVAALTMFLAREPLMDLAGSLFDGAKEKRKTRKARKAKAKTDQTESAE